MKNTVILAAGNSTRMKSDKSKIHHEILGKKIIEYIVDLSLSVQSDKTVIVLNKKDNLTATLFNDKRVEYCVQKNQIGTADAVKSAFNNIEGGSTLILVGDIPCLKSDTLKKFYDYHLKNSNHLSVLTVEVKAPDKYGRIIREDLKVKKIVEFKDASEEEILINEINSGVFLIDTSLLKEYIEKLDNNNEQGEYYITDLVEVLNKDNYKVGGYKIFDEDEIIGINDRVLLQKATRVIQRRINESHMLNGVTIENPDTVFIHKSVIIKKDAYIRQSTYLMGDSVIESNAIIGPNSVVENTHIGENSLVNNSQIYNSKVSDNTNIGPYAYIRPNSFIGANCKIGNFVEIKNSKVLDNSKVSHLAYVGDSDIGRNVNIGCGAVFVNFDGEKKHRSVVEDDSFIGCNSNIISPVKIGKASFVAAGTTVTEDVESNSLSIGRTKAIEKKNWVKNK